MAETPAGYANLCRLLTRAHAHGGRLDPRLPWAALDGLTSGLLCLTGCRKGRVPSLVRRRRYREAEAALADLIRLFGPGNVVVELQDDWTPGSLRVARELAQLADTAGVPCVATNNVHYARPEEWVAHDVLRCIHAGCTVEEVHPDRPINRERFLKSTTEMRTLFAWRPDAVEQAARIAERCGNVLPSAEDITPNLWGDPDAEIVRRARRGARERYGTVTPAIRDRLAHELSVITRLGYSGYMLMVSDVVAWARSQGIRCTGRGSAADSLTAYCLYLTDIDVLRRDLLFSRFLRDGKKPDVDTDFPSDRRDEVFRHVVST
ncbi:MAG: PHP domain-containing protein, partial [Capsulimonadaceae bacterium]